MGDCCGISVGITLDSCFVLFLLSGFHPIHVGMSNISNSSILEEVLTKLINLILSPERCVMIWDDFWSPWCRNRVSFGAWSVSFALNTPKMLLPNSRLPVKKTFLYLHCLVSAAFEFKMYMFPKKDPQYFQLPGWQQHMHLRCIGPLEDALKDVDGAYDSCNEAWARGEADKFRSTEFASYLFFISNQTLPNVL